MKLAHKFLLAGVATMSLAAAAPSFAQVVPGPGDFEDETPGDTFTGGDQTTDVDVGVDTDVDVGVDTDVNVGVNNDVRSGDANATGGSVGDTRFESNNVNIGGSSIGAALSADGCTAITGFDVRGGFAGAGFGFGRNSAQEIEGCRDFQASVAFTLSSDADIRTIGVQGLMNGRSATIWTPAVQTAAQGTMDAEARCGAGATRRSVFNAVIQNGCIQGQEAQADTTSPETQVLIINAPSAEATAEATGAPAAAARRAAPPRPRRSTDAPAPVVVRDGDACSAAIAAAAAACAPTRR